MTLKICLVTAACLLSGLTLAACTSMHSSGPTPPDQITQTCQNLRDEIITDANNNVPEQLGNNPTKQAQYYNDYAKYHCDDVLAQMKNTTMVRPRVSRAQ